MLNRSSQRDWSSRYAQRSKSNVTFFTLYATRRRAQWKHSSVILFIRFLLCIVKLDQFACERVRARHTLSHTHTPQAIVWPFTFYTLIVPLRLLQFLFVWFWHWSVRFSKLLQTRSTQTMMKKMKSILFDGNDSCDWPLPSLDTSTQLIILYFFSRSNFRRIRHARQILRGVRWRRSHH